MSQFFKFIATGAGEAQTTWTTIHLCMYRHASQAHIGLISTIFHITFWKMSTTEPTCCAWACEIDCYPNIVHSSLMSVTGANMRQMCFPLICAITLTQSTQQPQYSKKCDGNSSTSESHWYTCMHHYENINPNSSTSDQHHQCLCLCLYNKNRDNRRFKNRLCQHCSRVQTWMKWIFE